MISVLYVISLLFLCKGSGVEVWCEVNVMTDGLTVVNCKCEGVEADRDQVSSLGRVTLFGSTDGLYSWQNLG